MTCWIKSRTDRDEDSIRLQAHDATQTLESALRMLLLCRHLEASVENSRRRDTAGCGGSALFFFFSTAIVHFKLTVTKCRDTTCPSTRQGYRFVSTRERGVA